MLRNNLKVISRRLTRQKTTTALHLLGLTLGMTTCLLIGLFLRHELSYDAWHSKAGRTYRICSVWTDRGTQHHHFSTPMPTAEALRAEVPGLETVASWHPIQDPVIVEVNPQKRFLQAHIVLAEPELLDVFDIEVLRGDAYGALRKPFQALLTEMTAEKFFGREDPIGKTFKYRDEFDITVAGIIKDLPANTHVPASMLISYYRNEQFMGREMNSWTFVSGTSTYIVLPKNTDPKTLDAPLKALGDKYLNNDPNIPKHIRSDFEWQPLSQVHFDGKYAGGSPWAQAINVVWLWFFGLIGLAVLALACINFVNLSTAQALTRAKEVGVRKAIGAGRGQLVRQFLGEAWLLAGISGILAVASAQAVLPFLNQLIDKQISFDLFHSPGLVGALLLGMLGTGLLAGLYPAWVIARFDPVSSLKTGWGTTPFRGPGGGGGSSLRKGLVVAQFSISVALLIAVTLIAQQVNLLRSKSLGFDKDNIVDVSLLWQENPVARTVLAAELAKIASVKDFSFSSASPSSKDHNIIIASATDGDDPNRHAVTWILADDHFCPMYGLELLAGRFPETSDTSAAAVALPAEQQIQKVVVNKKCVETLGFGSPEAALDKRFWLSYGSGRAQIVGVVADFNTSSLHDAIMPAVISQTSQFYGMAGIKIEAGSNLPATIAAIRGAWEKAYPQGIFSYKFLDEQIDAFYKAETRLYSLFKIFSCLAMLISCLGLWGLATFAARQRTKEIGIRKVLGASVAGIVGLLSKDFLKLVIWSLIIASPIAYFIMEKWLQEFAYRIDIQWSVFALAGLAAVGVAFLTVSFQSVKAALANPVKSLRSE